jgi:site-specific recombinase XerC
MVDVTPDKDRTERGPGPRVHPQPFLPARTAWLDSLLDARKSAITVECYDRDLDAIAAAVGGDCSSHDRIADFDQSTIDAVATSWESAGASRSTVLRRLSALRSFATFLCVRGLGCSRVLAARPPSPFRSPRLSLDDDDIVALTRPVTEQATAIEIRNRSIVTLKAETGLTTGEIAGLDLADVDLKRRTISVARTHLEPRVLRISTSAFGPLLAYVNGLRGETPGPLFLSSRSNRLCTRSIQLLFRQLRRNRGVRDDAAPKSLRHSVGFGFAENGVALTVVADVMGLTVGSAARYFSARERRS